MQHLYTRSILTLSLLAAALLACAQPGGWSVKPSDFQFSMSMVAQIETNDVPNPALNNHVAAFSGNQIRGYAKPVQVGSEVFYFLNLYANTYLNDRLYFMAFVGNEGHVYESTDTVVFLHHKQVGDLAQPYILHFTLSSRPLIYSLADIRYAESSCTPGFLVDVQASDDQDSEGNGLTYSIVGGADAARFKINTLTGVLEWKNFTPDFEQPMDADGNNVYLVEVEAADQSSKVFVQVISVTVKDDPPPTVVCPPSQTAKTSDDGLGNCSTTVTGGLTATIPSNCATYTTKYVLEGATTGQGMGQLPANQAFSAGKTTVRYTVTDESGTLSSMCSFTVTVTDDEPLAATCPTNKTANTAPGTCSATAVGTALQTSDNCAALQISYALTGATTDAGNGQIPVNQLFVVGTTTVTYTAKDGGSLPATSCSFTVTVTDNEAPALSCPASKSSVLSSGCNATQTGTAATTSDNCSGASLSYALSGATTGTGAGQVPGGQKFQVGMTTVTYTVTDGTNPRSCSFTITLTENQKPTITCPADKTMTIGAGCETTLPDYRSMAKATDNCTLDAAIVLAQQPAAGTVLSGLGTTTVQVTATDLSGNSRTCTFTVTIEDIPELQITCPANQQLCNTGPVGDYRSLATVLHGCSPGVPPVTQSPSPSTLITAPNTPATVTLTADDGVRLSSCTLTVTWTDIVAPTARCKNASTAIGTNGQASIAAANVDNGSTDNCGVQGLALGTTTFTCSNRGANVVTLTVTDLSGLTSTCTATVTVTDPTAFCCIAPDAVCKTAAAVALGSNGQASIAVVDVDAGSTYDCGLQSISVSPSTAACSQTAAPLTVTLTVTDVYGRSDQCTASVTVQDLAPPTIVCPQNTTLANAPNQCGSSSLPFTYTVTAADNCSAIVPTQTGGLPSGSTFPPGVSTVAWKATDLTGASVTCAFTVTVSDTQLPSIICPESIVKNAALNQCSATISYLMPSFSDNCEGVSVVRTSGLASGSVFPGGVNMVTWKATDAVGNTAICGFTVTVKDVQPPTIACPANIVRSTDAGLCSAVVTYANPTFSDNCTGATAAVQGSGASGTAFPKGVNTVTWKVTDGMGLTKTCAFTVTVNDIQAPSIACPANLTKGTNPGGCTATVSYASPTLTDNCLGGSVAIQSGLPSGSNFPKGQTTVTWKATDGVGLTKTCSFRVTVNDTEAPTINCPASQSVNTSPNLCSAVVTYATPTAADNCVPPPTSVKASGLASGSSFPKGNSVVVWRATDGAGLTKTCSFMITVTDNQVPVITCPANISATAAPGQCSTTVLYASPTATDNCTVQSNYLMSGLSSGSVFPQGATVNVWQAIDNSGLMKTCSFTVTVSCGTSPETIHPEQGTMSAQHLGDLFLVPRLAFTLAPNPAVASVTVTMEGVGAGGGALWVCDPLGRMVLRQVLSSGQQSAWLDLSRPGLPSGLYQVSLRTESGVANKPLLVKKQ